MTSSAASLTLSARKRVVGDAVAGRRGQPAHHLDPAAAGQVHVEQDDVGAVRGDGGDRLVDVGGLGEHVDGPPVASSSARTPRRNIAWSSTITTLTRAGCSLIGPPVCRATGQVQAHLGALAGRRPDLGGAAVAVPSGR